MKPYFIRVTEQSPTMFWINNPTRAQADLAIENGALGCTNNPSYTQKMMDHPVEGSYAAKILDEIMRDIEDDRRVAVVFQQKMVKPIADKFLGMYQQSGGRHGYVSIQGDPIEDEDTELIVRDLIENRLIGPEHLLQDPHYGGGHRGNAGTYPTRNTAERHRDLWRQPDGGDL